MTRMYDDCGGGSPIPAAPELDSGGPITLPTDSEIDALAAEILADSPRAMHPGEAWDRARRSLLAERYAARQR